MSNAEVLSTVIVAIGSAGVFTAALLSFLLPPGSDRWRHLALLGVAGSLVIVAGDLLSRDWAPAAIGACCAIAWFWLWRQGRGRRHRRAAAALGEKSRALIAALVGRAREASRPSPVRRPALEAA